jgi:P pilus assembly chaperone PapD
MGPSPQEKVFWFLVKKCPAEKHRNSTVIDGQFDYSRPQ